MQMGKNLDLLLKEIFECRMIGNSTTNSKRYPTYKLESNYSRYEVQKCNFRSSIWNPLEL